MEFPAAQRMGLVANESSSGAVTGAQLLDVATALQINVTAALRKLAVDETSSNTIVASGGIPVLLQLLKPGSLAAGLQVGACQCCSGTVL